MGLVRFAHSWGRRPFGRRLRLVLSMLKPRLNSRGPYERRSRESDERRRRSPTRAAGANP